MSDPSDPLSWVDRAEAGVWVEINADSLDQLSLYAIRTRYPGDDPTPEEAIQA